MKKNLLGLLVIVICFTLVGCGNSASGDTKKAIDQGNSGTKGDSEETSDVKLYSTDDRLVFNANDAYYIVIDFGKDGYATSLKWMYDYGSATTAKAMVAAIKANMDENSDVKSVTQDGKYVVVDYQASAYEDLERSTAEAAFSMYKEVENN